MSFWSRLSGNAKSPYLAFSGEFFRALERRQAALVDAAPAPELDADGPEGFAVLEKRVRVHHTWLTLRRPGEWLYQMKDSRAARDPAAARRIKEEVSLLVGLSTSYHLAPFDVLALPRVAEACGTTFTYCCSDLGERAAAGPVPAAEVAHYGLQLAAELDDLHRSGLLHLAIAPSNVFLERAPKDSFLCRWRLLLGNFDLRGVRVGEPALPGLAPDACCAPEQHSGGAVSAQTDLYGLGATLYWLCAGKPPPSSSAEAAAGLEALGGEACPRWLAAIIASCLQPEPARRPAGAAALFDAFLAHCRVVHDRRDAEGESKGHAGPAAGAAKVEIADRFLLASANRLGRVEGGPEAVMKDLGPATRLKEATRLYHAGTNTSLRRAVAILDRVLGDWEAPASPLGQFAQDPRAALYAPLEEPERWVGKERWGTAGLPIPIALLWAMLDLQCKCYVSLIEDEGSAQDVERLRRLCEQWLEKGSLGTSASTPASLAAFPASECLSHLAQGLRYAGQSERARKLIETALQDNPSDFTVLFTAFMVARDLGDFDAAAAHARRIVELARAQRNGQAWTRGRMLAAELCLRRRDDAEALRRFSDLARELGSEELENLARQARCRIAEKAERADLQAALELARRSERLEQWVAAVEIAVLAGEHATARELIADIREEPRFNLATDRWYHQELARLEQAMEPRQPPARALVAQWIGEVEEFLAMTTAAQRGYKSSYGGSDYAYDMANYDEEQAGCRAALAALRSLALAETATPDEARAAALRALEERAGTASPHAARSGLEWARAVVQGDARKYWNAYHPRRQSERRGG